ncbi:MAG: NAD(P)/FAD-dependent oxidoreductase [Candidatus Tenebribacter burtonii]|jgi:L-2-hydroxyglutarate oxidase LhgO|nr:NAD(P)/FAD-dependent oxidoreductase [Candidatus Tenebribacter burtonii]
MEQVNILIIGAGIIGLAVAKNLSKEFEDVVLVEAEETFGRHTSSRNSEVIHSGIYYPKGSLKARLCVNGNQALYQYAKENNIPFRNCGKLIVANNKDELSILKEIKNNGEKNRVPNLQIINEVECKKLEPQIIAKYALKVPSTGIIDTHKLMQKLENEAEDNGAFIIYNMKVISIDALDEGYIVNFANGEVFETNIIVNCAGLHSDKIAEMVGIKTKRENLQLHWCKGEYYKSSKIKDIDHLIYPLPDPDGIFLGIHLTINLHGEIRFGPNAYYVDKLNYEMNESYKPEFLKAIKNYMKIDEENFHFDDCGIRAKLQEDGGDFRDFYIKEESEKGFPNFINCIGIESPGLTCCLTIAEEVKKLIISE